MQPTVILKAIVTNSYYIFLTAGYAQYLDECIIKQHVILLLIIVEFFIQRRLFRNMAAADKKELEMKEEIRMYLRKKDYYDILGIPRNAEESQIKKAYKKLALRFHPDKNQVQGAKQVFKKVSNAYSNLVDANKRADYDRFGPEQDRQPQYRPQHNYRQGYNQQDQFQQIFRSFFGGVPMNRHGNGGFRYTTFRTGGYDQNQQRNQGFSFIYLLAIFFVIYILPNIMFSKQQPLFQTNPSEKYRIKRTTQQFQNQYYVKEQFYKSKFQQGEIRQIERKIDIQYVKHHLGECRKFKSNYYTMYESVRRGWKSSCEALDNFKKKNPVYYQNILSGFTYNYWY